VPIVPSFSIVEEGAAPLEHPSALAKPTTIPVSTAWCASDFMIPPGPRMSIEPVERAPTYHGKMRGGWLSRAILRERSREIL
jgi:hypothetical protein